MDINLYIILGWSQNISTNYLLDNFPILESNFPPLDFELFSSHL